AAEGGIRHRVGLASVRFDSNVFEEIGVIAVEDSTVGYCRRQVEAIPATKLLDELDAEDAAAVVEADVVVDLELVALAGDAHVVVTIEPDLARPAGFPRRQRRDDGKQVRLRLLAAERTAHATDIHRDGAVGQP